MKGMLRALKPRKEQNFLNPTSLSVLISPSVYLFFFSPVKTCPCWPTGDILSRLSADTTQVSDLISQNVNVFLRSVIKGTGFVIFMFRMSWKLTLVTMMGFPFIALVSKLYGEYYKVERFGLFVLQHT